MWIGEWNKSVILTYVGMACSLLGMYFAYRGEISSAMICLAIAGVCDLFDGVVARKCKRNEAQKQFGIQLDSLVDVVSFLAFPVTIAMAIGMTKIWYLWILPVFVMCGIARLAYFNVQANEQEGPVSHYRGLPVTYTALILPLVGFSRYVLTADVFTIIFAGTMLVISILNILNIKIAKPRGVWYVVFAVLAIVVITVYLIFPMRIEVLSGNL